MNILITGGSSGIGEALVRMLRARGDSVVFTYRTHKDRAQELARVTGAEAHAYDAHDSVSMSALVTVLREGNFDGLVHNALAKPLRASVLTASAGDFIRYQSQGLAPVFALSQAFAKKAQSDKRTGSIVTVLSSYTFGMPPKKLAEYVTLKYALLGLTRAMASELTPIGIRVNAVSPAMTRTDFIDDVPARLIEMEEEDHPMKRIATPEEVAAVIAFLLSHEAGYISGANIPITGGSIC